MERDLGGRPGEGAASSQPDARGDHGFDGHGLDLESRASYLGGLVKGLALTSESEQGRILALAVELLGDLTRSLGGLAASIASAAGQASGETTAKPPADHPPRLEEDHPTFIACQCPRCGEDIFVPAQSVGPGRRHGLRLLAPSDPGLPDRQAKRRSRGPTRAGIPSETWPRELGATCPGCGEPLHIREASRPRPRRLVRPARPGRRAAPGRSLIDPPASVPLPPRP